MYVMYHFISHISDLTDD